MIPVIDKKNSSSLPIQNKKAIKTFKNEQELALASENFLSEFFVTSFMEVPLALREEMQQIFVCMDEDGIVRADNGIIYSAEETSWMERVDLGTIHAKDFINMLNFDLSYLPGYIFSVDFYIWNFMNHKLEDLFLVFQDSKYEDKITKRFGYHYHTENYANGFLLGTFGRVSDGWKFYPKLESFHGISHSIFVTKYKIVAESSSY